MFIANLSKEQRQGKHRDGDIDAMLLKAEHRGWKNIGNASLLGSYTLKGRTPAGRQWTVRHEMTKEIRFGGGMDRTSPSQSKLVPITRWLSTESKPERGVALIWPRPENMPADINGVPGAGMKVGVFDIGKVIVDTVIGHNYGRDSAQFKGVEIMNLGNPSFGKVYATLSNNPQVADRIVSSAVEALMIEWSRQGYSQEPPQILVWGKGVEVTVFEKVDDFMVLERLVDLGQAVDDAITM